jgi:HPt (histidine-containing phosphotransfer) domain-containing protein
VRIAPPAQAGLPFEPVALLENMNGSLATLRRLLRDWREHDAPRLLGQISSALRRGDVRSLARAAHAIAGVLGVFRATAACAAAMALEESARLGRISRLEAEAAALLDAVSELLGSLEDFVAEPAPDSKAA